ncbi:MAG: methyltransferase domain-containing protein [Rhizobiales bacterium]|nr:methyltransferase domain-containing protein [Hyphomicrobiales bacterium]
MTESDKVFAGSIPEFYDTYLVPLIFEAYAADLARRVASLAPGAVLEVAAGSGVVPRALAPSLAPDARYVVTDLNQPMLDHAAQKQGPDARIEWRQADALELSFQDASFDAVICQYGVMFFPDRVKGYREARRVLKSGGRYIFSVWDHIGVNEFADVVTEAAAQVFPNDPPRFMARTPHGYHDVQEIRRELNEAGFTDIAIETVEDVSRAPSPRHPAIAYCQGTPLRSEIEARGAGMLDHVTDLAAEAIAARWGQGPVSAKIQAHIITAAK